VPQIEVTFDIDANGIVNVSAKDLGTGKEQSISITASTKLSEDEIAAKVKEAEQFAEEDKRRKEEVDIKNEAEHLIYETEKSMKDLEEKSLLNEEEKARITGIKDDLQSSLNAGNIDDIKTKSETLTNEFHALAAKLYQSQQGGGQASGPDVTPGAEGFGTGAQDAGPSPGAKDENVVDADFEVVDDEENKQ
jgi:molecular chaperone DnaK